MPVKLSDSAVKELDQLVGQYTTENAHPGTVVGAVNAQGELIYLNAAGPSKSGSAETMQKDSVFAIYSCTKVVTAAACMQLVESGQLDLDAPAEKYVSELKDKEIIIESDEKSVKTRKAKTAITTRMLLTHTAGYSYSWYNQHLKNWVDQNVQEFSGQHLGMPLVNEPGTKFEYGIAMDWAGIVVERVSGKKLGEYCEEHIFKPLGMTSSAFDLGNRPDLEARLASMHNWNAEAMTFEPCAHPRGIKEIPMHSGGGGLFCSAPDFLTFLATLLNNGLGPNGARILKEDTVKTMFTNQCANLPDQGALGQHAVVPTTDKSKANDALELLPGQKKGWGLSFLMNLEDVADGRKAGSAEWGGVANLFWLADPQSELGLIVFNSALPYGLPAFYKMEADLQRIAYTKGNLIKA